MRAVFRFAIIALQLNLLLAASGGAQENDTAKWTKKKSATLDKFLADLHSEKKFNGCVLLAEDGKIVYEKSHGWANQPMQNALGPRSSFRLASVSKQFTAVGIMILAERGKLKYDDSLKKFLPELPYKDITIRQLLHHNAGLPDYMCIATIKTSSPRQLECLAGIGC